MNDNDRNFMIRWITLLFLMLLLQGCTQAEEKRDLEWAKFPNPLYPAFEKTGKKYKLDLSFAKMAWAQKGQEPFVWGPNNYKVNTIFNEKPKSIDILFIGDCTIAWGMIPKTIEQMTGKKTALYGYASNVMTVETAKLFRRIADYYLKDDGLLVYSFSNWALQKDSQFVGTSINEFKEMLGWSDSEFENFARRDKRAEYEKIFSEYAKPAADSKSQKKKAARQNRGIAYLRWDMDSITEYNPDFSLTSVHSEIMPAKLTHYEALQNNAEAASRVFAGEKVFMIPLYNADQHYLTSRTIYYSYYQRLGIKVADMGLFMPRGDAYTMENHRHVANSGGLMMSILIGKWLNRYFEDKSFADGKKIDFSFLNYYKERLRFIIDHTPKKSTIYLPASWVDKGVSSFMEKNGRSVITALPLNKNPFYFLSDTVEKSLLKNYNVESVYSDTLGSFLEKHPDDLIILSIKDDGSYRLSDQTKQYFRERGIKIDDLKFAGSLVALIERGKTVAYRINNHAETTLDKKILSKYGIQKLLSAGSHYGNKSEIIINGKNLSKQGRGFNYVIKKRDGSIESGYIDTYKNDQIGERVEKAVLK